MYVDRRLGGVEKYYLTPPPGYRMRVPPDVLRCVAYIGHNAAGGDPRYMGTGFFVNEPISELPGQTYKYLVTAKHVADKVAGDFWIRMNGVRGGPAIRFDGGNSEWLNHPSDPAANIAMLFWEGAEGTDYLVADYSMLLNGREAIKQLGIGLGDEVFMAGVYARVSGTTRNTPIVRKGNLAMMPDDKIYIGKKFGFADVYLVETHSFGGISGSPVFVRETLSLKSDTDRGVIAYHCAGKIYLLGLMHGHWNLSPEDQKAIYPDMQIVPDLGVSAGISIIVPAEKIIETMNHPAFLEQKRNSLRKKLDRILPVQDSATGDDTSTTGTEPERLAIDLPMDEAVKKMFQAGKPPRP